MTDSEQVADDIQGEEDPNQSPEQQEQDINPELVSAVQERISATMPTVQQLGQFEQSLQQNPELAKQLAEICPELIVAFVNVAQQAQGQQSGMNPPGGADGAMAPEVGADEEEMPAPAATSMGAAPPSMPTSDSPLRKQFYTGR